MADRPFNAGVLEKREPAPEPEERPRLNLNAAERIADLESKLTDLQQRFTALLRDRNAKAEELGQLQRDTADWMGPKLRQENERLVAENAELTTRAKRQEGEILRLQGELSQEPPEQGSRKRKARATAPEEPPSPSP